MSPPNFLTFRWPCLVTFSHKSFLSDCEMKNSSRKYLRSVCSMLLCSPLKSNIFKQTRIYFILILLNDLFSFVIQNKPGECFPVLYWGTFYEICVRYRNYPIKSCLHVTVCIISVRLWNFKDSGS